MVQRLSMHKICTIQVITYIDQGLVSLKNTTEFITVLEWINRINDQNFSIDKLEVL